MQPEVPTGDFLLGRDYEQLVRRQLRRQPCRARSSTTRPTARSGSCARTSRRFEDLLRDWGQPRHRRTPSSSRPSSWAAGATARRSSLVPDTVEAQPVGAGGALNEFDYAPGEDTLRFYDDARRAALPVGAHVRRLNPRGSRVMGKPHSRRLVRRSMPYGPELPPARTRRRRRPRPRRLLPLRRPRDAVRVHPVASGSTRTSSTHGLRGTREPIGGSQPDGGGTFTIPRTERRSRPSLSGLPNSRPHARQRLLPAAGHRRPALPRLAARPKAVNG